jgi:hypothetical protein
VTNYSIYTEIIYTYIYRGTEFVFFKYIVRKNHIILRKDLINVTGEKDKMGRLCNTKGRDEKYINVLVGRQETIPLVIPISRFEDTIKIVLTE